MDPFFTLIIPFYNVEKYIQKCVDSIKNQSFVDFEAIFVDDGSPDKSIQIVEKSIVGLKNFRIIRQLNGGLSDARNTALNEAKGKYIWFIDSDDWIDENALKILHVKITDDIDFIGFSNFHYLENKDILRENFINEETPVTRKIDIYNGKFLYEIAPWIYVFRHDFLLKNQIKFRKDIRLHEDEFFLSECLLRSEKIKFISDKLYYHRIREGSLMRTKNLDRKLYAFSELNKVYREYRKTDDGKVYWENKLYGLATMFYKHYFQLEQNNQLALKDFYVIFRQTNLLAVPGDLENIRILKFLHNNFFPAFKYLLLR